jgi:hypothetical protein
MKELASIRLNRSGEGAERIDRPHDNWRSDIISSLLTVECLDPESVLVSKAVKAPAKNKQLLRQAIASNQFPSLVDRILKHGGRLEEFL